ncbi:MAG: hypothetical protein HY287_02945 [Planctomycetes bacterium]|nr:hypothetical protein [Planctomycetota bacterium]MBI3833268.1 hypothetical protein [Planctomycetota bacterium]
MDSLAVVDRSNKARPAEPTSTIVRGAARYRIFDSVLCFGDSDWWYHNRGHADMQFMRRFARLCPTVYVNSLGVGMPKVAEG